VYPQTNIELIYSTPRMYIDALKEEDLVWPTKYDDIFPYADNDQSFWTGYFSSRANDKKYFRDASHTLHSSNKLFALAGIDQGATDAEIKEMEDARKTMMDVVGVVQHHDAITGTARQHVSNDYKQRVYNGREEVNAVYAQVIDKLARTQGFKEDNQWQWCQRQNGTYSDCPIASYADETTGYNMVVATHNPASVAIHELKVEVPHDNYKVFQFDGNDWANVTASVICQVIQDETHPEYMNNDCNMYIKQEIEAGQIGFTKIQYDADSHLHQDTCDDVESQVISTDELELSYNGIIDDGVVYFNLTDKVANQTNVVGFSLRWWSSFQSHDIQPSGAYIFRPKENVFDSYLYSNLDELKTHVCEAKQQFVIWFKGTEEKYNHQQQGDAAVRISMIDNLPVMQFDVELFGIPQNSKVQQEVTVNFHSDIKNDGEFWTDSNGMEMQKRNLNHRPTWNLTTKEGGLNITANMFPVNSAVSIIDKQTNMQMTVMNDRSQAGSVIVDGRIELMQNRRQNVDDWRGVNEVLNEKEQFANGTKILDKEGHDIGMSVPATYYLQYFNRQSREPLQRQVQQIVDAPDQQFYSINQEEPLVGSNLGGAIDAGFAELLK
jgi:lysosomal alpha-mannosidase